MSTEELLQAERRERPRMAIAAAAAAVLTLAGSLVFRIASGPPPDNLPAVLLLYDDHVASQLVSAACSALGALALGAVLDFLYRAARARSAEVPRQLRWLPWIGGVGVAAFTVAYQVALAINLHRFATDGSQTYEEARKAVEAGVPPIIGLVVQLLLALAIVLVSIHAMRVGLLTRFLGFLGVISGALFLMAIVPVPIVQVYWMAAVALLLAGRSLTGPMPPAWQSGEAIPWPSASELREQRVREAERRRAQRAAAKAGADAPSANGTASGPHPATSRRKRKKRR